MQELLHLGSERLDLGSPRVCGWNDVRRLAVTLLGFDTMVSLFFGPRRTGRKQRVLRNLGLSVRSTCESAE
jgi:hypothetical protein